MSAAEIVDWLNGIIWSPALIYLCLGAGLFFYSYAVRSNSTTQRDGKVINKRDIFITGISSFQALSVSLSGRVGVGNIAGVAAAIGFGGPVPYFGCGVLHS